MIRLRIAVVLLALAATAACTSGDTQGKDAPLETKKRADVEAQARQQADAMAALMGGTVAEWEVNTKPCLGQGGETADDARWSMSAFGVVKLPEDKHLQALKAVHDTGTSQNWEITEYRTLSDGRTGVFAARDPQSRFSISLASSKPAIQIVVTLGSPCFQPAPGEDPANG
ncbi:hypothetical protein QLQ12_46345 [Actinoplanes sp. NEAU-A12]|uniref:Uncharacterized protein n=1 Tax=Actinoplanes sandaracinus TaxID=3045177 RepID=A0ABT6X2D2_9ACTN|nr:hypothetical protein [Actinoplanes sandaracinus]MDI6106011.1 hypothetical protein [Actinoplanes sandaracinus]